MISNEPVSPTARLLVFERKGLEFEPGREIMIHGQDVTQDRQYSIASGIGDAYLEVLYRIIPEGVLTPQLAKLVAGDSLEFTGPFGSFLLRDPAANNVFIATGTGIAPALCFAKSHPDLPLTIYHGVRDATDSLDANAVPACTVHNCVSGTNVPDGSFAGRVTALLPTHTFPTNTHYYLCGSNDMIIEVRKQLKQRGVADDRIFSEAYFFW